MSILSWLFGKSKPLPSPGAPDAALAPKATAQAASSDAPHGAMAELKKLRQERRDHLYRVVRDVMLRSEVLASHYKFKVLSLDTQGQQFLVMVDLLGDIALPGAQLRAIETQVSTMAMQRHKLLVKAVYWRQAAPAAAPAPSASAASSPAAASATPSATTPVPPDAPAPTPRGRGGAKAQGFEPIGPDEVLAFKKAIGESPTSAPLATTGRPQVSGPRNAAVMTGFEDTQLLEPDESASPLSRTQFGDFN